MARFRVNGRTLNLRGIQRMGTMGGGGNYEFANEVAGLGANPAGQAKTGVGRTNQRTTANLRGEYGGR